MSVIISTGKSAFGGDYEAMKKSCTLGRAVNHRKIVFLMSFHLVATASCGSCRQPKGASVPCPASLSLNLYQTKLLCQRQRALFKKRFSRLEVKFPLDGTTPLQMKTKSKKNHEVKKLAKLQSGSFRDNLKPK